MYHLSVLVHLHSHEYVQHQNSQYASVHKIVQYDKWDAEEAEKRRTEEVEKIMNYLYQE